MFKHLFNIIKKLEGNVLTIGIDEQLLSEFNKNNKVNVYTLNKYEGKLLKSKKRKNNSGKTINIKRLKKFFKKNSFEYIICDYQDIKSYSKYVIRDIIRINSQKVYLYCSSEENIELIIRRFKRYGSDIEIKKFKSYILLEIDNTLSKTNWFLDKIYYIIDTIYNLIDLISNILIS